ncbi:MAG: 4-hydroxyphenylpyruvate dioxygenase [Gammaproteobacteria bacterium]|nr:4-hydroxyphenylpyruvate dioxygenase [Gammaproteobacteria bacterium]MCH9716324.1 4-hydroxyphenylpyruvate dioxygenase [Gammaproteobacteria bacterium]MCH9763271.1 4-hydroxyphenylpyruvate dioxygenase [Gammaproteobacteria bacterium]
MSNQPSKENPCGLDGFAFLEFAGPDAAFIHSLFEKQGFTKTATHPTQAITCYQQNNIQFILNDMPDTSASKHAEVHGAGACAMGFRVHNAKQAFEHAIQNGATAFNDKDDANYGLLAIEAIGGSVIYFVDDTHTPVTNTWQLADNEHNTPSQGLLLIDHLTHNVNRGNLDTWADFYDRIFGFKEIRFFDIKGQVTGLISRALGSPCGKIKIPLNESTDDQSQIEEFLRDYHGEGIQHIALSTNNIYQTVRGLREAGINFLDVPDTYYEGIHARVPWHKEPLDQLQAEKILLDGTPTPEGGLLLQIFTENLFGPVFFEIIQRQGNDGFGEGNFKALFEAIERDQIKRGTLKINVSETPKSSESEMAS